MCYAEELRNSRGRLRRRLAQYYQGSGVADPVRIEVPKGTYIPVFVAGEAAEQPAGKPRRLRAAWLAAAHAALCFALGFHHWNWKECEAEG